MFWRLLYSRVYILSSPDDWLRHPEGLSALSRSTVSVRSTHGPQLSSYLTTMPCMSRWANPPNPLLLPRYPSWSPSRLNSRLARLWAAIGAQPHSLLDLHPITHGSRCMGFGTM